MQLCMPTNYSVISLGSGPQRCGDLCAGSLGCDRAVQVRVGVTCPWVRSTTSAAFNDLCAGSLGCDRAVQVRVGVTCP